ncbi:MAG TPA: NAD(P)H-dependent glycerol-3-phosphate dehydrogenase [Phycisphaerales bacterium]|jgi:glycerol-3-phosphate dehydrogenase (NAD(P)+)|nr:NAD(P)H-dependent glycerol-3-phosphate dehydrogenase [Phycisphaerales bacterium]
MPNRPSKKTDSNGDQAGAAQGARIAILGIGQMGLVCAGILANKLPGVEKPRARGSASQAQAVVRELIMWGHSADEAGALLQSRRSDRLPQLTLPDAVRVTNDLRKALDGADLVVSAIPVQFTRDVWKKARGKLPAATGIISVSKGIETETMLRPTQLIAEALGDDPDARPRPIGVLSGPTIASELARGLPATMIVASDFPEFSARVQALFACSYLRVYTNEDVVGVELAGALKNVIAIAAGILDGLHAGFNAKSALLARGLAELTRLGTAMGASSETFFGLAGVGDLATTCFSPEGRNRSLGEALGRGQKLKEYLKSTPFVVEGVETSRAVIALGRKFRVEMPIMETVHAVLFEGLDPIDGIGRLMSREQKAERVG